MNVEVASSIHARLIGLLGRREFDGALLLIPCHDIHTVGMRRSIDVAFIARDGTVIESHLCVGPNRRLRNRAATATLERFACNDPWYLPGDRIQGDLHVHLAG